MTEAEAKTKWCPMVRVGVKPEAGGPAGINDPETQFRGNCIGSDCAMWRWTPQADGWWKPAADRINGFCGIAGKPEG